MHEKGNDTRFGATSEEWGIFSRLSGSALLPVVSNPSAEVSGNSKIVMKGKVPSLYNKQRRIVGIPGWTAVRAESADIAKWSAEADYGICIQTSEVRAIDIDVKDTLISSLIVKFIQEWVSARVGVLLPRRWRSDSGSCLLALTVIGSFPKRRLLVEGGAIELLANGQQFIAAGTHPGGARYRWQWPGEEADGFPLFKMEELTALWDALRTRFEVGMEVNEGVRGNEGYIQRKHLETNFLTVRADSTLQFLEEKGLILGEGRSGEAYICCPWKDAHTMDSGVSETAYFPAGSHGYDKGHFKCLHAHCAGRADADFIGALGILDGAFTEMMDDLALEEELLGEGAPLLGASCSAPAATGTQKNPPARAARTGGEVGGGADEERLPKLERDKTGRALATLPNLVRVLKMPKVCGEHIAYDSFKDELVYAPMREGGQWRSYKDNDVTRLRYQFENHSFKPIPHELMRHALGLVGEQQSIDTAQVWLKGLEWDGIPRIERFLTTYAHVEDNSYHRAVSMYIWTALAARVLCGDKGIKADMMPVLVGPQGVRKSTLIRVMAPDAEHYASLSFTERDADLSRKMRGRLVVEVPEMRGLKTRDVESIRDFISSTHESWVPKFKEFSNHYARRFLFLGTTNDGEFLNDPEGSRRFLPISVYRTIDTEAAGRDRLQLWAEARDMTELMGGIAWEDAERLARDIHHHYTATDIWQDELSVWLDSCDSLTGEGNDLRPLTLGMLFKEVLDLDPARVRRGDELRLANALRGLGYKKERVRVDHKARTYLWKK